MSNKTCVKCNQPRMTTASGKELTMCEEHQREYWRSKKPSVKKKTAARRITPKHHTVPMKPKSGRVCKQCKTRKPLSEFGAWGTGYKRTCHACEGVIDTDNHILIVHGEQVILASVVSQTEHIRNKALILDFYETRGYLIQHVFESEVNPS